MNELLVVACVHGNEIYGLEVLKKFSGVDSFVGNPKAVEKKVRFIDSDLNRVFPGKKDGNYEEKLALEINKKLVNYDYVVDLHSSSSKCPLFGIITKPMKEKIEFAKKLGLKKVVVMSENYASGKALIDFCKCGISLEIGPHEDKTIIDEVSEKIENFISDKSMSEPEIFEVFDVIKQEHKNIKINNFEFVNKGQILSEDSFGKQIAEEDFIAVLVSEKAYNNVLCLAGRKVNLKDTKYYS